MQEYILRRLVLLVPTVLGVTLLVFLMMRFIPGDPVSLLLGDYYTEETAAAIRRSTAWIVRCPCNTCSGCGR